MVSPFWRLFLSSRRLVRVLRSLFELCNASTSLRPIAGSQEVASGAQPSAETILPRLVDDNRDDLRKLLDNILSSIMYFPTQLHVATQKQKFFDTMTKTPAGTAGVPVFIHVLDWLR